MFTGIIEQLGKVQSVEDRRGQRRVLIETDWKDLQLGESIAVNGVCLTVAEVTPKAEAMFFVSEETIARSTLAKIEAGSRVNLERALTPTSRMGGHFVQGHVDTQGLILNLSEADNQHKITVALDYKFGRYCVEKGSIALDGVSLTINALTETKLNEFMISCLLVPHTWKHTTLSNLKIGDAVNVEVDVLAKYIERLCPQLNVPSSN